MADERSLILNANQNLGEIVITPEIIEVIIGIATSKVEGVYGMRGAFASNVTELLGRTAHEEGIYLTNEGDGLRVSLYCYLEYGASVPKVTMKARERVGQQVLFMTDIDLPEVNVHVVAVVPRKLEQPTIEEFFGDEGEENE